MKTFLAIVIIITLSCSYSLAKIINVPADIDSIQGGIDKAVDGDTVLIAEGTFLENINFKGKAITVASMYLMDGDTSHISRTIIDGSQPTNPDSGSVVYFVNGEDTTSVLMGFTITGGSGTYDPGLDGYGGGGINIVGHGSSGGKIIHNKIINNHLFSSQKICGGAGLIALFVEPDRSLVIEHNEIKNNSVTCPVNTQGGGTYCKWISKTGYVRISNNFITGNTVTCTGTYKAIAGGIGLSIDLPSALNATVENNIISHNELHCKASMGAGIYVVYWSDRNVPINDYNPTPLIANNLIYNNYSQDKGAGIGLWTVGLNTQSNITPQPKIINNTLHNNKSSDGCALFNFDCFPLIMNNIFWDDLSIEDSHEIFNSDIDYRPDYLKTQNDGKVYVYYSDIQGGWDGESNIDTYPAFVDTSLNDFSLLESSRCIGSGIGSLNVQDYWYHSPPLDYYGNIRPNGIDGFVDMGAIESPFAAPGPGMLVNDIVYSTSLDGNFLGDSPERSVDIYLPPGYDVNQHISYPVIYLLHGYGITQSVWMPAGFFNMNIKSMLDSLITEEKIQPVIVVMPNAFNKWHGSWYTNSEVTGNWEDFIAVDLVEYIDDNYRTIPKRESRGIAGHSMGGYGAFILAMKHPDIFSSVFSLSAGWISFEHSILLPSNKPYLIDAATETDATQFENFHWIKQCMIAGAAAFAPNKNSDPFNASFPVDENGVLIDSVWARWLEHDPYTVFVDYKSNLLQLDSIWLECGTSDDLYTSNYYMYQALDSAGIETIWDEYTGDHFDKISQRIEEKMLPFFSATLVTSLKYVGSHVQTNFLLKQNYPNPFNPLTTIEFQIPNSEFITLKVYNILGKEVSTLVSKKLNQGSHNYTFDGSNLASGIYYYQLVAGDFREVKKMILLR